MPSRRARPAMYNTPVRSPEATRHPQRCGSLMLINAQHIRNGGFGALQVEAVANRPLSIARRHLAASQLRMRDIEPDELSSSEWVRFLVMTDTERERWMTIFRRRRRNSDESTSSAENDRELAHDKAEEAAAEAADARQIEDRALGGAGRVSSLPTPSAPPARSSRAAGRTPAASLWARAFDDDGDGAFERTSRPRHRRAITEAPLEAPPTYESVIRARTPPPAYEPRSDDEGPTSPRSP